MNKKLVFGLILIVLIMVSLGAVSATDPITNNTNNNSNSNSTSDVNTTTVSQNNNVLGVSSNNEVSQANDGDVLTSDLPDLNDDLEDQIANSDGTLSLQSDYLSDSGSDCDVYKNVVIEGNGYTLNGNDNNGRFLQIHNNANVIVKNLNFINYDSGYYNGAVYINSGSSLTLINCTFNNNHADNGGAIYNDGGSITVINSTFTNNRADKKGGAIYSTNDISVSGNTFSGNTADDLNNNYYSETANFDTFETLLENGGSISLSKDYVSGSSSDVDVYKSVTIYGNGYTLDAANENSRFFKIHSGTVTVYNLNFENYDSGVYDGAILIDEGASLVLVNCTFNNNHADNGGAIYNDGGSLTVANSTFTLNRADKKGGAIYSTVPFTHYNNNYANNTANDKKNNIFILNYSFDDLATLIHNNYGGSISLTNDYSSSRSNGFDTSADIDVNGNIIINGNGKTLDACGEDSRFLNINSGNVIVYNTNFINFDGSSYSGAIELYSGSLTLINCTFNNNRAGNGGAVYNFGGSLTLINSTFTNNYADKKGGAIYSKNDIINDNNLFANNTISGNKNNNIYIETANFDTVEELINNSTTGVISLTKNYTSGGTNDIVVSKDMIIYGNGYTLDACNENSRFLTIQPGCNVIVYNLNLINYDSGYFNGAIYLYKGSSLTLQNCTFANNHADNGGCVYNAGGKLTVYDSKFICNYADDYGGAIYSENDNVFLQNNTMLTNTANGITNDVYYDTRTFSILEDEIANSNGVLNINYEYTATSSNDIDVYHNMIINGNGHILNAYDRTSKFLYLHDNVNVIVYNTIFTNFFSNNYNGFIKVNKGCTLTLINCTFLNCTSNNGGIYNYGDLNVVNCTFYNCMADSGKFGTADGGAIYNDGGNVNVNNSCFMYNSAWSNGGAIYNNGGNLNLFNNSFAYNFATLGGAIYNNGNLNLINNTLIANYAFSVGGAIYSINSFNNTGNIIVNNTANAAFNNTYANGIGSFSDIIDFNKIIADNETNITVLTDDYSIAPSISNGASLTLQGIIEPGFILIGAIVTAITLGSAVSSIMAAEAVLTLSSAEYSSIGISAFFYEGLAPYFATIADEIGFMVTEEGISATSSFIFSNLLSAGILATLFSVPAFSTSHWTTYNYTANSMNDKVLSGVNYTIDGAGHTIDNGGLDERFLYLTQNSHVTIKNTIFENFNSDNKYGAFYVDNTSTLTFENCTFINNHAYEGGSIYNSGILTLTNNTFINNSAKYDGGAVYNNLTKVVFSDNTFENNLAGRFGGALGSLGTDVTDSNNTFKDQSVTNYQEIDTVYVIGGDESSSANASIIEITNKEFDYGNNTFDGLLVDVNSNLLANRTISLNLIRLSTGASKVYNVTTREDGSFSLPITLAPGAYIIEATFNGDNEYMESSSEIYMYIKGALLNTEDWINGTFGNNLTYSGSLTYLNSTALTNKTINVNILRISDGVNKNYTLTTNENGTFSMPINLSVGNYFVQSYYNGIFSFANGYITINNGSSDNKTISTLSASTDDISSNKLLYGQLFTYTKYLPYNEVTIELTRLSNGLSKNYTAFTYDYGIYSLPINLGKGTYSVKVSYNGNSDYQPCMYKNTFSISE